MKSEMISDDISSKKYLNNWHGKVVLTVCEMADVKNQPHSIHGATRSCPLAV